MLLREQLRQSCERNPRQIALIAGQQQQWSFEEFDQATDRIAASLARLGVVPGDRIALQLANSPELVLAYFGCFKQGAVAVPINNRFAPAELAYALDHSASRILISQSNLYSNVLPIRSSLPSLERVFLIDESSTDVEGFPFSQLVDSPVDRFEGPTLDPNDVAAVFYTSGTTARPKGVTHTQRSLTATEKYHAEHFRWQSDDVACVIPPMCHILGFATQMLPGIAEGGTLVIPAQIDARTILETIQRVRATRISALPVLLQSLLNDPDRKQFDIRSLRTICAGGDAVPVALQERFQQEFGVTIFEGCGMTEIVPFTLNRPGENRVGSIGRLCPGMEIRLIDDRGHDVPMGESGEILVRSDAAMSGYWREPEISAATFADGYVRTGDLGRLDEDGYYWFMGRKKEIIIRGGSNISPLEVEEVLYQHPAVRECGVVGAPHFELGEVVWAYVTLKPNSTCTAEELQSFCSQHLAIYKVPERIEFLQELPKGTTGKVHRRALREFAKQG